MRLATFETQGRQRIGVVLPDSETLVDVTSLLGERTDGESGLATLIGDWDSVKTALTPLPADLFRFEIAEVTLQAPLPRPARNLICVGRNYVEHAREFAASGYDGSVQTREEATPDAPVFFTKATTTVTGPYSDVGLHPDVTREVDYEAELAVVVGRAGRNIDRANALDHVWGYTIVNDVTARDLQKTHKQWFLGKSLDTFCPMGPWVVTADEVDLETLVVTSSVNGERRQQATLQDMIFDIPTLIAVLSAGMTLNVGDIICTGTPAGVGIGFNPPKFLSPGDTVEVTINQIGTIRNTFR